MNENQQPLQDEENTAKENQAAAPAEAAETGEPEQPESPAEDRVFGMLPRHGAGRRIRFSPVRLCRHPV